MSCGIKRAFTLMELVIAVLISSAIILGLGALYSITLKSKETFLNRQKQEVSLEFLLSLQRGLYGVREFNYEGGINTLKISYITNYGLVKPFVRVEIFFGKDNVIYKEKIPYSGKELVEYVIPITCRATVERKEILRLKCADNVDISFVILHVK